MCYQATIFPLLANVVQFTKPELEHIRKVQEHTRSTTTASGILSSFFLAPATDEQDGSFTDPAAKVDDAKPAADEKADYGALDAASDDLFGGWLTPSTNRTPALSATPLKTPFSTSTAAPPPNAESVDELKKKVLRLKKLLSAANTHIEKLKIEVKREPADSARV